MSWYVETLLRESETIRCHAYEDDFDYVKDKGSAVFYQCDDEWYDDLLLVERQITKLYYRYILSNDDLFIINGMQKGLLDDEIARLVNKTRPVVTKRIKKICEIVSEILGGKFTNKGFAEYIVDHNHLNDIDKINVITYIQGYYEL